MRSLLPTVYRVLRYMKVLSVGSRKEGNTTFRYPCEDVSSKYPEMGWKFESREEKRGKERVSVCGSELCEVNVWGRQREGEWHHAMVVSLREREQQAWRRLCVRFGVNLPVSSRSFRCRGREMDEKRRWIGGDM